MLQYLPIRDDFEVSNVKERVSISVFRHCNKFIRKYVNRIDLKSYRLSMKMMPRLWCPIFNTNPFYRAAQMHKLQMQKIFRKDPVQITQMMTTV